MPINVKKLTAAGAHHVFYGVIGPSGYLLGGTTTAPVAGDQDGNPMLELIGVKDFPFTPTDPQRVTVTGNDRPLSQFIFQPTEFPQDNLVFGAADLTFNALAQSTKVRDLGAFSLSAVQPSDADWPDLFMLVGSKAKTQTAGAKNLSIWHYLLIPRVQVVPKGRSGFNEQGDAQFQYAMNANPFDVHPWGEALSETNEGTTETIAFDFTAPYRVHMHRFTGDGSQVTFNLDYTPAAEDGDHVLVWVDGTLQDYTTDYTVSASAKALTFEAGSTPADGAKIVVLYCYTLAA